MWTSIASKPASRSTPAPCAYCSTIVAISSRRHRLRAAHPERAEHARRRERGRLRPHRVRDRARVADLRGDRRALGVHRVGELAQTRADLGVVEHDLMTVGAAGAGDRAVRDRRHADAAGREPAVELDELGRDDALGRAALEGRGLDDPVAQLIGPSRAGAKGSMRGHAPDRTLDAPQWRRGPRTLL